MAKFKPARARKSAASAAGRPQAVGCVIVLLAVFAFVYLVMYFAIKQG
jgi:hypothetical protein